MSLRNSPKCRFGLVRLTGFVVILTAWQTLPAFAASPRPARNLRGRLTQYGVASWYGAPWQGRLMASGRRFNEHALTAAHRTLPLGTEVKVTNLRNGRSVVVRIEDRGPSIRGRLIDLSHAAARELGFVQRGLTYVKVEVLRLPTDGRADTRYASRWPRDNARAPIG